MIPIMKIIKALPDNTSVMVLTEKTEQAYEHVINNSERSYLETVLEKKTDVVIYRLPTLLFVGKINKNEESYLQLETARKSGAKLFAALKEIDSRKVMLKNLCSPNLMTALLEGLLLSNYTFDKYKKEKEEFFIEEIFVPENSIGEDKIAELINVIRAIFAARDLVNEPLSFLTAPQFSKEMEKLGTEAGFDVEVFNKQKIESLKMGGLLAVNKGSIDPPTFNLLEWKPDNATNKKPVVLVGKGIVYDTGGLSLKPTPNSMDFMKTDMAGAAVMISTLYAIAKNKLPIHVVALIPATDNRPDGNAYVPGDVITMFDGTTVEIKNTDAEGRLILADALSYAKKYNPELVIDYATLTGSADIIAGTHAAVVMGNSEETIASLKRTGLKTYERLIEVPIWEEYGEALKSNIADLNNLGTREAQSSIAGKFLEHFTDYKWVHIDSAGTPFYKKASHYLPAGGTGFGVRLMYNFLKDTYC
ncbi:leucyl aminopeptidase family protein [Maribellus mangrovi]|uniref:leucyl aminopeptidase family protein n=1 Tax=Maribellus mangrovi TaxID=3133146 RepID=UPI0030ECDAE6